MQKGILILLILTGLLRCDSDAILADALENLFGAPRSRELECLPNVWTHSKGETTLHATETLTFPALETTDGGPIEVLLVVRDLSGGVRGISLHLVNNALLGIDPENG